MGYYNTGLNSYQKWFIGNDIRAILLNDEEIVKQVGSNIFPLIAPETTEGDFIIYIRNKYNKSAVKMGVYQDECEVAVVGISDNYDSAIALASKIDNALSGQHTLEGGVRLQITLSDSTETFEDDKYIETLVFTIK
jgi:hypothetical protein